MARCISFERHQVKWWIQVVCIGFCFLLYVGAETNDESEIDNHDVNIIKTNANTHDTDQFEEAKSNYVDESGDVKSNPDDDINIKSNNVDESDDGKSNNVDESDDGKSNNVDESDDRKSNNVDESDEFNSSDVLNETYTSDNNLNTTMETSYGEVVNTSSITNSSDGNMNNTEVSSNSTIKSSIRWPCKPYPLLNNNHSLSASVLIINNETKLGNVIFSLNGSKECALVLFYSPYCEFCTNMAPLYNAVGRSYNNLIVVASDAQKVMGMSARYGIVGIPTVLFFYSGKAVAKYNRSRTVSDFQAFILELTGLSPSIPLNITSEDDVGPILTTPKESRDYYLIFSIIFLVLFFIVKMLGSFLKTLFISSIAAIKSLFKREKVE